MVLEVPSPAGCAVDARSLRETRSGAEEGIRGRVWEKRNCQIRSIGIE